MLMGGKDSDLQNYTPDDGGGIWNKDKEGP
jgi:hypothetical protein